MRYAEPPRAAPASSATPWYAALRLGRDRLLLPHRVEVGPAARASTATWRRARPRASAEHPHRTGAGQPQAGAADARPRTATPSAFAKLGIRPLTRELVRAETNAHAAPERVLRTEAAAGARAAARREVARPRGAGAVRAAGLGGPGRRSARPAGAAAMRELADACGTARLAVGESVLRRAPALAPRRDSAAQGDRTPTRSDRGQPPSWTGRPTPNCVTGPGTATGRRGTLARPSPPLLWDWERFTPACRSASTPLHYELQRRDRRPRGPTRPGRRSTHRRRGRRPAGARSGCRPPRPS